MSQAPEPAAGGLNDEELLADLFDQLLDEVLQGRTPELATLLPDRPDLRTRVRETYDLACSVAGRREPGRPVLGGYQILSELGRGGMGTVYLARHEQLGRQVAIKVLPQSLALSPRSKQRFLEEAKALARLRHENIVHIHRIVDDTDMLAFEMEYVEGPSLQGLLLQLREHGPQPPLARLAAVLGLPTSALQARSTIEFFVRLGLAVARALGAVHRSGLVHRDIKPSNILLRKDGRPVIADFGLARDEEMQAAHTIAFAGTPIYAAPERLRDGDLGLDARADVYSLGVTLYEAITMTPPYQGRSTADVLRRIESGHVVPLRKHAPHVSHDLQTVLAKAMEPDQRHRYPTADEFADDLERLLTLEPVRARPAGPLRRLATTVRRHRRVILAAAAGAVIVGLALSPVIARARAVATAQRNAASHLDAARRHLLAPECLGTTRSSSGLHGSSATVVVSDQVAVLERALREYELALPAIDEHTHEQAAVEHAVVAMVRWLRTEGLEAREQFESAQRAPGLQAALAALPPVARAVAQDYVGRRPAYEDYADRLAGAERSDQFAVGLLALLLGDLALCERIWADLETDDESLPLLDAGLGLLFAADGFPERAFPRLFHAVRSFPRVPSIGLELADTALAMGETRLARKWLEANAEPALPADSATVLRHRRMRADLLTADDETAAAAAEYRKILRLDPQDATARHRLAMLAIREGDLAQARRLLERILVDWPDNARAHLDLARLALHADDREAYLRQARYALAASLDRPRSRGTAVLLSELLRLGGLLAPLASLVPDQLVMPPVDDHDVALARLPWSSPAQQNAAARGLLVLAHFDRARIEEFQRDARPLAVTARAVLKTLARCPGLQTPLPPVTRLTLTTAAPWFVGYAADVLSPLTTPMLTSLGDPIERWHVDNTIIDEVPDPTLYFGAALAIGEPGADGDRALWVGCTPVNATEGSGGVVQVRSARDGQLMGTIPSPSDNLIFGMSIVALDDVNDDGITDFAVGGPMRRPDPASPSRVILYCGRRLEVLHEISTPEFGFGVALAGLGDVDGDGVTDLAVGTSPTVRSTAALGVARVFSGRTGGQLYECRSDRAGVWFGAAVANAGDVDADGVQDLVIGGNHGNAPGLVRVCSGRDGQLLHTWSDDEESVEFGRQVLGLGDLDGDGRSEVMVSATGGGPRAAQPGRVFVYDGRTGLHVATLEGESPGDRFGFRACLLSNWNGHQDRALAVTAARGGLTGGGYVRVFLLPRTRGGATRSWDNLRLEPMRTFYAPAGRVGFGLGLADAGDREQLGRSTLLASTLDGMRRGHLISLVEPWNRPIIGEHR